MRKESLWDIVTLIPSWYRFGYGFGYGMSYTDFVITAGKVSISNPGTMIRKFLWKLTVKNTGDTYAGKEVVQIYVSCPQGDW